MKKTITTIFLLCFFGWNGIHAQISIKNETDSTLITSPTKSNTLKTNELKINLFYLAVLGYPEVSYERLANNHSLGISIGNSLGKITFDYYDTKNEFTFTILPYYRFHFGNYTHRRFFIEANAIYFQEKEELRRTFFPKTTFNSYGFGAGLGLKLLREDGWLVDIVIGYGRVLNRRGGIFGNEYPRLSATFGRRF